VRVITDEIAQDPARLLKEINLRGVTVLESVPSLIDEMLNHGEDLQLPRLRWLLPTGEALSPECCRRWMARYPHVALLNAYGPAECSDDVAYYRVDSVPDEAALRVPIGKPVTNTHLYIVNRFFEPLPVGVAGELCVSGVSVGRGYLNDAVRTAEPFIPDPFSEEPGARLYKTGDLARYLPDGNIEFLGRVDDQVKVRGFRIELGEIEARLLEHPEVRAAVVVAREDTPGGKRLVAYVVSAAARPMVDGLRAHMKAVLPEYMVPAAFVFLEALPLTPNGKVDRRALPVPDVAAQLARQYVAPRTSTEELLARIWAEVLGLERVGIHDNFFELGGHSLLAMKVMSRLRMTFHVDIGLRRLFEVSTVEELAEVIEESLIEKLEALDEDKDFLDETRLRALGLEASDA
jgi:acyl-coenzyme A synthetase/AMP-(fatty) acid ligase/acyl carrier protein